MRADIPDAVDDEGVARAGRDGGDEPRDGGQVAAGEYVADEVVGTGVGGVAGVGDRDALEDRHPAVALQQAVDAGEVGFKVCRADRLEHLDADDIAVGPRGRDLEVTVVGLLQGDSVRESCGPDALLGAERCGGYGAAGLLHGLDSEAAPAGADFEDVVGWLGVRVVDEALQFVPPSVFERLSGGAGVGFGQSYRARVCYIWGEEGGEHVVAVVVGIDVGLGVFEAVVSLSYSCEAVAHGGSECGAIGWSGAVENEKLWGS